MGPIKHFWSWLKPRRPLPLDQWFFVSFDDAEITIKAAPPGKTPWQASFPWSSITRVCFEDNGPFLSDALYMFTSLRPESYVVPTEASGGRQLLDALMGRTLFPYDVAIRAFKSTDGGLYCWPPLEATEESGANAC